MNPVHTGALITIWMNVPLYMSEGGPGDKEASVPFVYALMPFNLETIMVPLCVQVAPGAG